jgi:hypothetical protein
LQGQFVQPRNTSRSSEHDYAYRGVRKAEPQNSRQERQKDTFSQQLPNQAETSGSQRGSDAEFVLAGFAASKQEARDVCACDQQYETDGSQ